MKKTIYFPNWFFPKNLGDSVLFTFIPKIFKEVYGDEVEVVCIGELAEVLKLNGDCILVRNPTNEESSVHPEVWKQWAFKHLSFDTYVIYPEWHPKVWEFWNKNFDYLINHPTANIITVSYLLQLRLEHLLWTDIDFTPKINIVKAPKEDKLLAIVPARKLGGRPDPHPGCDGKGFRFNGDEGLSWWTFVETIMNLDPTIKIVEFSDIKYGFANEHIPHLNWKDLAYQASRPKVVVQSDGGMHHVFNSQGTKTVYLSAQTINKPDFYRTQNTDVPWHLYKNCSNKCPVTNLTGWPDLLKTCDKSCEKVDPIALADYVYESYFK